jgi:antitoxin component of RelBE/YafQ-DinJ toxin-antitoxin module
MKTDMLQIRVQPDEKDAFQEVADIAGLPLSAWVRSRLRQCAIRELEDASRPIRFLKAQPERDHE